MHLSRLQYPDQALFTKNTKMDWGKGQYGTTLIWTLNNIALKQLYINTINTEYASEVYSSQPTPINYINDDKVSWGPINLHVQ